jgi:hypothetical protein
LRALRLCAFALKTVLTSYSPICAKLSPEILPGDEKRTLTSRYNARPTWLDSAHRALDAAVCAAYGWPADLGDDEILKRLLALNGERFNAEAQGRRGGEV